MRIKVLSGGRKNIEMPLSDAELNLQMRQIGIEETVPMCRLVDVSEKDNPLHRFEGQTVNMDEVNFFAVNHGVKRRNPGVNEGCKSRVENSAG